MNFSKISKFMSSVFSNTDRKQDTQGQMEEIATNIKVNPNTKNSQQAWEILRIKIDKKEVKSISLDTPIYENKVRFVCISDTHTRHRLMTHQIPPGDVLIHAGDFTNIGTCEEVKEFSDFMKSLNDKFKYKCVIAGNHELTFDPEACNRFKSSNRLRKDIGLDVNQDPRTLLTDCIYLEDSIVELFGLKIYGAPWQPTFGNWAFNVERGEEILKKWNKIPNNVDVLITHGPPLGFGDICRSGYHVGCCELLSTVRDRVRPKYHIFGHIHEDNGIWTDGKTHYINASTCNSHYMPIHPPILFDIELPSGFQKKSE